MTAEPLRRDTSLMPFLLTVASPLVLFALLAYAVRGGRTFSWDRELIGYFDEHYYDLRPLRLVTEALVYIGMAAGAVLAALVLVALAGLYRRRDALFWGLAVGGMVVLAPVLKSIFERPQVGDPDGGYSFPSGNAMTSIAGAVALFLLFSPARRRWTFALTGAAIVGLYGFALVVLLWHYPSDVVAGWCIALAWVMGLWLALRPGRDQASGVAVRPIAR